MEKIKMSKIITIIVASTILLIIGCTGDNDISIIPEEPVGYDTLIPLNVGNYWLYNLYDLEPDGSGETPEKWVFGFIIDGTMTRFINGDSTICYKLFTCGEDLKPYYDRPLSFEGSKLIYHNRDGTYYSGIERYDTLKLAFNDLIFSYPAEKEEIVEGHVFYYSTLGNFLNVPDDAITQYECISKDSLISTPAGDFNCVVYRIAFVDYPTLFRDEIIFFIKPGLGIVGMVMMVYHYNLNQYRYINKTLLKSYYLNKEEGG